jgi:transposase InsO family protein
MIQEHKKTYPVSQLCRFFKLSRSGFYHWKNRPESKRSKENCALGVQIVSIFEASRKTYGSRRIHRELQDQGVICGKNRIARLMQAQGLQSAHKKRFKPKTTDSNHNLPTAPNVINQNFGSSKPNEKWACDITYVPTQEGFVYTAVVIDLFSRKVIGLSIHDSMKTELCTNALTMALNLRQPPKELIHHSDRGSQYASYDYTTLVQRHSLIQSMSRTGNCYDNAMVESFFHTLKVECVYPNKYQTKQQAKEDIQNYIHNFYNNQRRHSSLDYLSPNQYEQNYNNAA